MKLSKWRFQQWCSCPRQFYYSAILKLPSEQSESAAIGERFHDFTDQFFADIDYHALYRIKTLDGAIDVLAKTLPEDLESTERPMYNNFIRFEANHLIDLKRVVPDDWKKFFVPLDRELRIETPNIHMVIDRVDLLFDNNASVMEYKFSSWWSPTDLRRELVLNSLALKTLKKYRLHHPITHISCYNPKLDNFLFEKINTRTISALMVRLRRFQQDYKDKKFNRRVSGLCAVCDFRYKCLVEEPDINDYASMEEVVASDE